MLEVLPALLAAASVATPNDRPVVLSAFLDFCKPGAGAAAELASATAQGWQSSGADRTKVAGGETLTLRATDQDNHGERLLSCGVRTNARVATLAAATRAALGFDPALDLGTSATFFAIADGRGWRSGAKLDRAGFLAAKAQGTYYSIVASADDAGSGIYALHSVPGEMSGPQRP